MAASVKITHNSKSNLDYLYILNPSTSFEYYHVLLGLLVFDWLVHTLYGNLLVQVYSVVTRNNIMNSTKLDYHNEKIDQHYTLPENKCHSKSINIKW